MPLLPGTHMNAPEIQANLITEDKLKIAETLAVTLAELHSWTVEQYGEYDPQSHTARPFEGSYQTWLYNTIRYWLGDAKKYSVITSRDMEWVEALNGSAPKEAFTERFRVHMLHQRVLYWGCAKAINRVTWDNELSFCDWAEKFTESADYLLN